MKSLRSRLLKGHRITHPGSRGGHPWWDGHEWRYDEPPQDRPIHHEYIERLAAMGFHIIDETHSLNEDEQERTFRGVLKAARRLTQTLPGLEHILQNHPITLTVHSALDPLVPRVDYELQRDEKGHFIDHIDVDDKNPLPFFSAMDLYYKYAKRHDNYETNKARDEATQELLSRMASRRGHSRSVEELKEDVYNIWSSTPRGANETINADQAAELRRLDKILEQINQQRDPDSKPVTLGTIIREKMGKSFRFYMRFGPLHED